MEKYVVYVIHELECIYTQYSCDFYKESDLIYNLASESFFTDNISEAQKESNVLANQYKSYKQICKLKGETK